MRPLVLVTDQGEQEQGQHRQRHQGGRLGDRVDGAGRPQVVEVEDQVRRPTARPGVSWPPWR
jgi:hypothetical protein